MCIRDSMNAAGGIIDWRDMHANEYIAVSENLAPPPIAEGFSEFLEKK